MMKHNTVHRAVRVMAAVILAAFMLQASACQSREVSIVPHEFNRTETQIPNPMKGFASFYGKADQDSSLEYIGVKFNEIYTYADGAGGLDTAELDQKLSKVAGRGQVDGVFITTTAVGEILPGAELSGAYAKPGDKIIVTGDVGRHGATILLARDAFGIEADVTSDCAPLWETVRSMLAATKDIHVIRDATRGGVGTVLYEIASESHVGIRLDRASVPVDPAVSGVCGMLGLEPLYLACEGRMVVFAPADQAEILLDVLRKGKYSENAAIIGEVIDSMPGRVTVRTPIGAETLLPPPGGELLPRIC